MKIKRTKWHDDADGRYVAAHLADADGAVAVARLVTHSNGVDEWVKSGAPEYQDSDGDFVVGSIVRNGRAQLFVPWGAVTAPPGASKQLILSLVDSESSELQCSERYRLTLPQRVSTSKCERLRPLVGLAVAVGYADGVLQPAEIRCIKEIFVNTLGLANEDVDRLKELLRVGPPRDLAPLARSALYRHPGQSASAILQVLEMVAAADGRITQDELTVIEQVARAMDVDGAELEHIRYRVAEAPEDPWLVLGVNRGATDNVVKSAFRKKIAECHPDKWATAPEQFRALASTETRRATLAYASICESSAVSDGRPRPTSHADYASYGVCERFNWVEWESVAAPKAKPAHSPQQDPLAGRWLDAQRNQIHFIPQGSWYRVEEYSFLGKVSDGSATRHGGEVHVTVRNMLLGEYSTVYQLDGMRLVGTARVMGMAVPVVLYRL